MNEEQNIKQLPKGWKWVKLGGVVNNLDGKRIPLSKDVRAKRKGQYRYYGATEIVDYIDDYIFEGEHLLVGEDGANLLSKSKALAFIVDGKFWVNNHAHVLQAKQTSINKYLCYYFNSLNLAKFVTGTAQPKLTQGNLNKIEIPICSIKIQQAIVSKIEELFSELDKGIENLHTAQQQLKTYRQSVLKWAFEGKLTNENVKEGELPEGWKMVKTTDVIDIINNGYTPTKGYLFEGSGEIPFIKVYNLNFNGSLNFKKNPTFIPDAVHKKDLKRSICFPGDVLINIVGPPLGKVSVVSNQFPEWNINQAIVMFRPNAKVISKYISYFMQNSVTINWLENTSKATAGQWNVKVSTCREIPFPFCSIEEQYYIVQSIESRLSVADKMEESVAQSLQQAEVLRQSILKKAFEGKLV